jgi:tetratricopeptide (TPR) repeat protein
VRERREVAASLVSGQNLPWWIAGAAMFVLILFVGMSMVRPAGPVAPSAAPAGNAAPVAGGSGVAAPDISTMTPIEAATRLFNRVMTAVSAGDSAQAQAFLPMAIAAYQRARPLDNDGLFHLSMLNRTAMNLEAALDNAIEILERDPNHLLGLAAAAEAAIELGELDEAERHYRQLTAVYEQEVARGLPEYDDHLAIVQVVDEDAERFLSGR